MEGRGIYPHFHCDSKQILPKEVYTQGRQSTVNLTKINRCPVAPLFYMYCWVWSALPSLVLKWWERWIRLGRKLTEYISRHKLISLRSCFQNGSKPLTDWLTCLRCFYVVCQRAPPTNWLTNRINYFLRVISVYALHKNSLTNWLKWPFF